MGARKEAILGVIEDSADKGNLRRYPVALFITLSTKAMRKKAARHSLLAWREVVRSIEALLGSLRAAHSLEEVRGLLSTWSPPQVRLDPKDEPLLNRSEMGASLEAFIGDLGGDEGDTSWNGSCGASAS